MPSYTFDVSLYANITVTTETQAAALAAVQEIIDALEIDDNFLAGYNSRQTDLTVDRVGIEADESGPELTDVEYEDDTPEDAGVLRAVLPADADWLDATRDRD